MRPGPVIRLINNAGADTTSQVLDVRNWDGLFTFTQDTTQSGNFSGTVVMQAMLAGVDESGKEATSGTFLQYGGNLTVGRVERFRDLPSRIRVVVTRTTGNVTVFVQPFMRE